MTTDGLHDDLDTLLKRYDPAGQIDPGAVARVSRMVLTRIAAEHEPAWRRHLRAGFNAWGGLPRYAGSLALGLALGLAVGLVGLETQPTLQQPSALDLYAQAQPLSPVGL